MTPYLLAPTFSFPEPTILLACGRNRELWEQPFWNNKGNNRILPIRFNSVLIYGACLNGCSQSSRFLPQARRIVGSGDENVAPTAELKNVCACVQLTLSGAFSISLFCDKFENARLLWPIFWKMFILVCTITQKGQGWFIAMSPSPANENYCYLCRNFLIQL